MENEIPFGQIDPESRAHLIRGLVTGSLRDETGERVGLYSGSPKNVSVRASSSESPSGTGSGCGNVKGYIDCYGTMTIDGAFAECLSFLETAGFLADGHGASWGYHYGNAAEIGIFTNVFEDKEGLQIEWEYHDDAASQVVRQKTDKRLRNKKTCGLSIGFYVGDGKNPPVGWTYDPKDKQPDCDYIFVSPQYYEEVIPQYSTPEYLDENMERAYANMWGIYLLCRVHVFEVSQTEIPANEVSLISEVRSRKGAVQDAEPRARLNQTQSMAQLTDAEIRAKKDAKREAMRDSVEAMSKAFKKAKEAHDDCRESHEAHEAKLDALKKAHSDLSRRVKEVESHLDEDDDEEVPEKPKSVGAGRSAFNNGGR